MTARSCLAAAAAAAALFLAGCSSDDPGPGAGAPAPAPTTTAATSAAPTTAPAGGDECAGVADDVRSAIESRAVDKVEVIGQCTTLAITTRLGDGEAPAAKEICDAAAKVAYTGGINAIRVTSSGGTELAQGIAGAPCLAA